MAWQNCFVLTCNNSKRRAPNMQFYSTPSNEERRREWIQLAGKNPDLIKGAGRIFCEEHFEVSTKYFCIIYNVVIR